MPGNAFSASASLTKSRRRDSSSAVPQINTGRFSLFSNYIRFLYGIDVYGYADVTNSTDSRSPYNGQLEMQTR